MNMKNILRINRSAETHWVGDGFPVSTLLSYQIQGSEISPFLMLDYAGPAEFEPSERQRGVGQHPHRGFETVTIVYQGEVEHKDNVGNMGKIGPGDVQWMTAARGILHEEMHSRDFSSIGGTLEMIQLWVNLPAKDKMSAPKYQTILQNDIPVIKLDNDGGEMRVIAGNYSNQNGAAKTFTPINVWDLKLIQGHKIVLDVPIGFTSMLLVLEGDILVNNKALITNRELVVFEIENERISLESIIDSKILVLSGEPINEPIAGQGPFVMNTKDEITQAFVDYREGHF